MINKLSLSIQEQIEKGISVLKRGGVIAYPTDTVYGLGAGTSFSAGIRRVYEVKKRPLNMPLPLLLSDESQLEMLTESITPLARLLIRKFWPGGLTLVLRASSSVPEIVTAGGNTVAVRIPAHPVPIALIRGLGTPVIGTSANSNGKPSALSADEVYSQIGDKLDFVIDGGRCFGGIESTIVDVTGEKPIILREGAISSTEIEHICESII